MQVIVKFIPWIAYAVLVDVVSWPLALGVSLALALVAVLRDVRSGGAVDVLDAGGIIYFTALLVPAVAGAPGWVQEWSGPASNGWIALLMWISLVIHRPFLAAAARSEAPAQAWDQPYFTAMVVRIAAVWAASYTVGTLVLAAATVWPMPGVATATNVVQVVAAVLLMRGPIAAAQADGERQATQGQSAQGQSAQGQSAQGQSAQGQSAEVLAGA